MFELGSRIDELEEDSVSIEDLIKDEEERGGWDCPQSEIHQRTVDFILDSIDNTVFKLENGHYIQFYF